MYFLSVPVVLSTVHEVGREQEVHLYTISVVVSTVHEVERFRSYTIPGTVNPVHKGTK